ncbi:MAG: hypothetical protein GKR89_02180 [Candidatus Latescibacteria bacterium]|nr:hypothetical protein [Candidatus Latescibacterota bacterium]
MIRDRLLDPLKSCELHVHLGGCLYPADLLELGRSVYRQVDWSLFTDAYEQTFGQRPDPIALYEEALADPAGPGFDRFRRHSVFVAADGADFARFQAKFNLAICLYRHWHNDILRKQQVVRAVLDRHRAEGIGYIEYRSMYMGGVEDVDGFFQTHLLNAQMIQEASDNDFLARYIISLPRWDPLVGYQLVQRFFDEHPELIPTIVGLDFCFFEDGYPPRTMNAFFARLRRDNQARPERALEVLYHVGEMYFDKSLESAVRWCHEAAELGPKRLGHATALGLDPAVSIGRRPRAHQREPAQERRDQIAYDLRYRDALEQYGIIVDVDLLRGEDEKLQPLHPDTPVEKAYDEERLEQVRWRQTFVLDQLAALGTAIETCPTSNLRIGGVPGPQHHPIHRFLQAEVDLAVGADDPGVFDQPLAAEIDWVQRHTNLDEAALLRRLGDPRRLRLSRSTGAKL